jgi:hypothetical protein
LPVIADLSSRFRHVRSQDKLTVNVRQIGWQPFFDLLQKKSNYTFLYKDNVLPRMTNSMWKSAN